MPAQIESRPTPWITVLLLCGKCGRKLDGGYGPNGRDSLKTTLRSALKATGRRREVRILETRCMGICPKKAVTALNASRPESLKVIPKETPASEILSVLVDPKPL